MGTFVFNGQAMRRALSVLLPQLHEAASIPSQSYRLSRSYTPYAMVHGVEPVQGIGIYILSSPCSESRCYG